MIGWLINGVWVAISAVTAVQWLLLSADGKAWNKAETIKQWTDAPEDKRAVQINAGGESILIQYPKTIERCDLSNLMWSDTQQLLSPQKRPDAGVTTTTTVPEAPAPRTPELSRGGDGLALA